MLSGHGLDLSAPDVRELIGARADDRLFGCLAVRAADGCLSIVYKAAAEIGELGDNVAALRHAVGTDPLLARALASPGVRATVVAHTRWASVGLISEANAHPLNGEEAVAKAQGPMWWARSTAMWTTTPTCWSSKASRCRRRSPPMPRSSRPWSPGTSGPASIWPKRSAVRSSGWTESVGIVANAACDPDEIFLALRGSGQSVNIGFAEDAFVVASEAYGLVEETGRYLRMHGEGGGQVVRCSRLGAGTLGGISRWRYDGTELPVAEDEIKAAEITTRDVDRRGFRHFLLKEISESPLSVRKTLRGKLVRGEDDRFVARLGEDVIPPALRQDLASGRIHLVLVVGQGTAAVAGQAVATAIAKALPDVVVRAMPGTELSGWGLSGGGLPDDMSGVLVVAISQSGTTTDTNRTVDLVRARQAHVVSIVNRRNSDLVQKSHGVLYTSDGRDIEMSVASTKAFYSQVAAGHLLACGLAAVAGKAGAAWSDEILGAWREMPSLLEKVLVQREEIGRIASARAPGRRSWAVVGSGPDRVAAAEVRIKLSELCYKAIALDGVEDKKHIDLSAEPLVLVMAPSTAAPMSVISPKRSRFSGPTKQPLS